MKLVQIFKVTQHGSWNESRIVKFRVPDSFDQAGQLLKCNENSAYVYPKFEFESSLVTEIDLVCGEEYKVGKKYLRKSHT